MLLKKQQRKQKKFLKLLQRSNELSAISYKARRSFDDSNLVELKEPYQRGWIMSLDLIQEAKNRQDSFEMLQALDLVQEPYYTKSISEVRIARRSKNYREAVRELSIEYSKKYGAVVHHTTIGPKIHHIKESHYDLLPASLKPKFYRCEYQKKLWDGSYKAEISFANDIPEHYIKVKVSPYMITHARQPDPEIEREKHWVDAKMDDLRYQGYSSWSSDSKHYKEGALRMNTRDMIRKLRKGEIEDTQFFPEDKTRIDYW